MTVKLFKQHDILGTEIIRRKAFDKVFAEVEN